MVDYTVKISPYRDGWDSVDIFDRNGRIIRRTTANLKDKVVEIPAGASLEWLANELGKRGAIPFAETENFTFIKLATGYRWKEKNYKPPIRKKGIDTSLPYYEPKAGHLSEEKQPWEMTKEEFRNWDFKVPEGGASKTPKTVFSWQKDDYETLYDLSQHDDIFRFEEILGKGWRDWKPTLSLKEIIRQNKPIRIYRAGDKDIIPGSYVSESKEYAIKHGEIILKGDYMLFSMEVKPSELMIYGDPHEFIYIPESVEIGHKRIIEKALKEGKPVPPEVLKDYPGIAEKKGHLSA